MTELIEPIRPNHTDDVEALEASDVQRREVPGRQTVWARKAGHPF